MSTLFGAEHVRRYRETDGEEGHIWREGSTVLLLTTTGRNSGNESTTPLIYGLDGRNPVIVASKGGAPEHPGWYRNLSKSPEVGVQIKGDVSRARARVAAGEERERLWRLMTAIW
ncbi:MAG: nitroreductase family deazaflavin-dependent oxidoreductase, partial [Gaiellaceae bacterium]